MNIPATNVDILIVGAGPAGLAAAACCIEHKKDVVIVEMGPGIEMRDHSDAKNLGLGVGGCGLYSDGKFSFYPSATNLWNLPDKRALAEGYEWMRIHLSGFGMPVPEFPDESLGADLLDQKIGEGEIISKKYPSLYLPLGQREQLTKNLQHACGTCLAPNLKLERIRFDKSSSNFNCRLRSYKVGNWENISAKTIVFAGGRFGPVSLFSMMPEIPQIYRRLELGVRIQQPASDFFLNSECQIDPKLILTGNNDTEYRTFCCCRNGEIVAIPVGDFMTVSGRGDCEKSGFSNVGFNLRIERESIGGPMWKMVLKTLHQYSERMPITEPWESFFDIQTKSKASQTSQIARIFGEGISNRLAYGLLQFQEKLSINYRSATLVAPAVEAVAYYPKIDDNLSILPYPLWVAGDSTGMFRGLTAALVSGYYTAKQTVQYLNGNKG